MKRPARPVLAAALVLLCAVRLFAFSFAVLGDSQGATSEGISPVFRGIMGEITALAPDSVVHCGDWTYAPKRAFWEKFLTEMRRPGVPFHLAVGNHDTGGGWRTLYAEMIGRPPYYSFRQAGCLFILLNPYLEARTPRIDDAQFAWLEKELEADARRIFVFVHPPLYPVDGHVGRSLDRYPADRARLAALLGRRAEKTIVFCGHEHLHHAGTFAGLRQIITGGAGGMLVPGAAGAQPIHHYLLVTVKDDDSVAVAVIRPGNIAPAAFPGGPETRRP